MATGVSLPAVRKLAAFAVSSPERDVLPESRLLAPDAADQWGRIRGQQVAYDDVVSGDAPVDRQQDQ